MEGSLGIDRLDEAVRVDASGMLESGATGVLHYGPTGERMEEAVDVFVARNAPPSQMFVFGAIASPERSSGLRRCWVQSWTGPTGGS
jgi:xanthine dehydrogenase accessory factor